MLIIAQPKSASSSVQASLGDLLNIPVVQDYVRSEPSKFRDVRDLGHVDFPNLRCLHSDSTPLSSERLNLWAHWRSIIFKQHVLPLPDHLDILSRCGYPIVFLSRDPEDSATGYIRAKTEYFGDRKYAFRAVVKELELFRDTWRRWGSTRSRYSFLEVTFTEVTTRPRETLTKVLEFFELPGLVPGDFVLSKKRYTRYPKKRKPKIRVFKGK